MIEIHFSINGTGYIIHRAGDYKEIICENNRQRVENEKAVCREYGLEIPTDANCMNTHRAIELLIERLMQNM